MARYEFLPGSEHYTVIEAMLDRPDAPAITAEVERWAAVGSKQELCLLNTMEAIADGAAEHGFLSTLGSTILAEQHRKIVDNAGRGYTVHPLSERQRAVVIRDLLAANSARLAARRERVRS